jgi:hypothetical protein
MRGLIFVGARHKLGKGIFVKRSGSEYAAKARQEYPITAQGPPL